MRDLWTNVPTVRLGTSEWSKSMRAQNIINALGGVSRYGTRMGGDNFGTFNSALVSLSSIWAPVVGNMVAGNQIMNTDEEFQADAIATILTGSAVGKDGTGSDQASYIIAQLKSRYKSLPWAQRQAQVPAICASVLTKVSDPAMRARIQATCDELTAKTWWETWKWPVIVSGLTFAGLGIAFVVKPKFLQFGDFSARL